MPDCVHWSMPSQPSADLLLLPKLIPWCPENPHRQQSRECLNVGTWCPSKMQVYLPKNEVSGIVSSSDSKSIFCLPGLVLPASKRTSWEDWKKLSTSSSPGRGPKASQQFSKPHAKVPVLLKKPSVFLNSDLPESVNPERLYSDYKCCRLFL